MSGTDPDVSDALRELRDARAPAAVESRIALGAMDRLDQGRGDRRRWFGAALAVGGAALLLFAGRSWVDRSNADSVLIPGMLRSAGATKESIALGPHVAVLSPQARLRVDEGTPQSVRVRTEAGKVEFAVERLRSGGQFIVETDNGRVEVVGTRFSVDASDGCTAVLVDEGTVRVTPTSGAVVLLEAGGAFTFCASPGEAPALAADAALMHQAKGLIDDDDLDGAAGVYTRVVEQYPDGPWAAQARRLIDQIQRTPRSPPTESRGRSAPEIERRE